MPSNVILFQERNLDVIVKDKVITSYTVHLDPSKLKKWNNRRVVLVFKYKTAK